MGDEMIKYDGIPSIYDVNGETRPVYDRQSAEVRQFISHRHPKGTSRISQTGQGANRDLQGEKMKCECGCGQAVKEGNRFVNSGHSRLGTHHSAETKKKMRNASLGEKNHMWGAHHSIETRIRMSEAHKGKKNHNYGKHLSEATKEKLRAAHMGKSLTEAHRRKLSELNKGKRNHMYGKHHSIESKEKMGRSHWGSHPTEETRKKLSEIHKRENLSPATLKKMSKANKGANNYWYGKHHSAAVRKKIGDAHKIENLSAETRQKMREAKKNLSAETRRNISAAQRRFVREHPTKARELARKRGLASIAFQRENGPYWYRGVPFASGEERQAMVVLCEKFNITPIEGVNCHIKVNGGEIDFRLGNLFVEYHPHDWDGLTHNQYYEQRRRILDENGFQACRLVVVESLKELEEVY